MRCLVRAGSVHQAVVPAIKKEKDAFTVSPLPSPTPSTVPSPSPRSLRSRRLRGLDGLRALAAAAVLLYHLIPNLVPGGFLGVDVFFVLSGFLITALLVREHHRTRTINLREFVVRRARRLFPAVALMAVTSLIVAGFLNRDLLVDILWQFIGVVTFSYNWVEIVRGTSYFDASFPHLWTNVWSLAVEQQFYFVWPLIVMFIVALGRRWRWIIPVGLGTVSAALMAWYVSGASDFTRAYQGTDSHAFGLMIGATLALAVPDPFTPGVRKRRVIDVWGRGILAWLALAGIIACWCLLPDNRSWMYPWGTLGVCLLVVALIQGFLPDVDTRVGPARLLATIIDNPVLRWLGERSYGIYLWHWPLWVIATVQFPRTSIHIIGAVVAALSIVFAALSYQFVEEPMRRQGILRTLKDWLAPSLTSGVAIANAGKKMPPLALLRLFVPLTVAVVISGVAVGLIISAPRATTAQINVARGESSVKAQTDPTASAQPSSTESLQPSVTPTVDATATPTGAPSFTVAPTGDNVSVIGDSVSVAAAPSLSEALPGIDIDAEVSRSIIAGIDIIHTKADTGDLRPYVVVALATNSQVTEDDLDDILATIGSNRRLVLVTGFGPQRDDWIFASNAAIAEWSKAHADVVRVADWAGAIVEHTDYLASDSVHPDGRGGDIFASLVKQAIDSFTATH